MRKSVSDQGEILRNVLRDLGAVGKADYSAQDIRKHQLLRHKYPARRLDRFATRRLSQIDRKFVQEEHMHTAMSGVLAIGWYKVPKRLVSGHFDIVAGHDLFEIAAQTGAALIRSLPSCKDRVPVISQETKIDTDSTFADHLREGVTFTTEQVVFAEQTVQTVAWIRWMNTNSRGHVHGRARAVSVVGSLVCLRTEFPYTLLTEEEFNRSVRAAKLQAERSQRASAQQSSYRLIA